MTTPAAHNQGVYLSKLSCLGSFYEIGDLNALDPRIAGFANSDAIRQFHNEEYRNALHEFKLLLLGETNRQILKPLGGRVTISASDPILKSPQGIRLTTLSDRLEHEFRKELECPASTRGLSPEAYHAYLEISQEEGPAARGRAFAFTLKRNFSKRTELLKALRKANFRVYTTISCNIITSNDQSLQGYTGKVMEGRKAEEPRKGKKSRRGRIGWKGWKSGQMKKNKTAKKRILPHLHGLAVFKGDGPMCNELKKIRTILGRDTFVKHITPADPERVTRMKSGRTAALAEGFLAYALYMAQNYDEPCPIKHLKRYSPSREAQRLTDSQKRDLHPNQTLGEMKAYRQARELLRVKLKRPRKGRQTWAFRHRKAIRATTSKPIYDYPATAVLRDGYTYTIKPEWGSNFETMDHDFIPCMISRPLVWQEHEADQLRQDFALGIRHLDGSLTNKALTQIASRIRKRDGSLTIRSRQEIADGIRDRDGSMSAKSGLQVTTEDCLPGEILPDESHRKQKRTPISKTVYENWTVDCELELILHLSRFRRVLGAGESPGCLFSRYTSASGAKRPHPDTLLRKVA